MRIAYAKYAICAIGTLTLSLAISLKAQAQQWTLLGSTRTNNGTSVWIDVDSVHYVRDDIYHYVWRFRDDEGFMIGRDRVDCAANAWTMLVRFDGPNGDGRIHETVWLTTPVPFSDGWSYTSVPGYAMPAYVCNFVWSTTQQIPALPQNWDSLPASWARRQTNDGTFFHSNGDPIHGINQLY